MLPIKTEKLILNHFFKYAAILAFKQWFLRVLHYASDLGKLSRGVSGVIGRLKSLPTED
jgi:hypothetical protein